MNKCKLNTVILTDDSDEIGLKSDVKCRLGQLLGRIIDGLGPGNATSEGIDEFTANNRESLIIQLVSCI